MRSPRGLVKVNGIVAAAVRSWEVESNSLYHADTFRVELSLWGQPPQTNWSWWAQQQTLQVQIFLGFPLNPAQFDASQLTSLVLGNVDLIETDPIEGVIVLQGRDLTSLLIDLKTDQKWQNLTSSQIATKLAANAGLTPQVTSTTTRAGNYYDIDHVLPQTERSAWDILTYLAEKESFQVYVSGQVLYFGPPPPATTPYEITWQNPNPLPASNATRLRFSHNLTLASDVIVKVRSWNMRQKQAYTKTATSHHKRGAGTPQIYTYTIPGLTPAQCAQRAQQLANSISAHEIRMHADQPGDVVPTIKSQIQVRGTPYDQLFYPETIRRTYDFEEGIRMIVEAKNSSPESTVII